MHATNVAKELPDQVSNVLANFIKWLSAYGETSLDYQSFFAGRIGGRAKALYYQKPFVGTIAIAPMIFCEAFLPSGRRLFHHPIRFPIADAHYAMGFAFLYEATGEFSQLEKAVHFLTELEKSRCTGFKEYCWGYPFDWTTRNGVIKKQTPLITTTPYVYEAFLQTEELFEKERAQRSTLNAQRPTSNVQHCSVAPKSNQGESTSNAELCPLTPDLRPLDRRYEWREILESIARHAANDIKDFKTSEKASSCSYTPFDEGGVINAAAYRAFLLTSASQVFSREDYWKIAERNLNFVLENQNPDGSWFYAVDGVRDFIDHFHTCFVMKALAKIHTLTGNKGCEAALAKGVKYYLASLFAEDGLPKPFSKAPRLTVYERELYDCAECINLCLLLRGGFPRLETTLETVVAGILKDWIKPDGSFRSRRLHFGWDNVPMHRWGQAQMFRSLALYLDEERKSKKPKTEKPKTESVRRPEARCQNSGHHKTIRYGESRRS
jgi:hypothetical protein